MMQAKSLGFIGSVALALPLAVHAQDFAALVSPPRFELPAKPGKTLRSVIEVTNRSTTPGRYRIHTADWSYILNYRVIIEFRVQVNVSHKHTR